MPTRKVHAVGGFWLTACLTSLLALLSGGVLGQEDPILARYDVSPRPIALIPPGTVVDKTAPEPYTNLIVKTYPRLGAGDLDAVNQLTKDLASFLHTSLVAKVSPVATNGGQRYRLDEVATGFSAVIPGRCDTVLSPDTERKLGANLGFLQRLVLARCYEEQQKSRYLVRSDTMAIVDTPAIMLREGKHRWVIIRYGLLVSERSGRLDSLVWMIDLDNQGGYGALVGNINWLPPNMILDGVMNVDGSQFTLGVPSDLAFACTKPPQTECSMPPPAGLAPLAALPQFTPEQAKAMEIQLWLALQQLVSKR